MLVVVEGSVVPKERTEEAGVVGGSVKANKGLAGVVGFSKVVGVAAAEVTAVIDSIRAGVVVSVSFGASTSGTLAVEVGCSVAVVVVSAGGGA